MPIRDTVLRSAQNPLKRQTIKGRRARADCCGTASPITTFDGIYDVPEAARYLKACSRGDDAYPVESSKIIRWIRLGISSPELSAVPGNQLLIGFEDLVSMRIVAAVRAAGFTAPEIRDMERWLRKMTESPRPFATETLWTGQGHVYVELRKRLVAASSAGQMAFTIMRDYIMPVHGLEFEAATGLAKSWEPVPNVLLQPMVQFGAPCIKGTRIPTRTIAGMVEAGDSTEWVASAYGLSPESVEEACGWERRLRAA